VPGDLDRIFDLAYRSDDARSPSTDGGAGLGLAIARGFVEAHDGELTVQNVEDGCRFVIRLRLDDVDSAESIAHERGHADAERGLRAESQEVGGPLR
jgi:signal transduction histidine kinase